MDSRIVEASSTLATQIDPTLNSRLETFTNKYVPSYQKVLNKNYFDHLKGNVLKSLRTSAQKGLIPANVSDSVLDNVVRTSVKNMANTMLLNQQKQQISQQVQQPQNSASPDQKKNNFQTQTSQESRVEGNTYSLDSKISISNLNKISNIIKKEKNEYIKCFGEDLEEDETTLTLSVTGEKVGDSRSGGGSYKSPCELHFSISFPKKVDKDVEENQKEEEKSKEEKEEAQNKQAEKVETSEEIEEAYEYLEELRLQEGLLKKIFGKKSKNVLEDEFKRKKSILKIIDLLNKSEEIKKIEEYHFSLDESSINFDESKNILNFTAKLDYTTSKQIKDQNKKPVGIKIANVLGGILTGGKVTDFGDTIQSVTKK